MDTRNKQILAIPGSISVTRTASVRGSFFRVSIEDELSGIRFVTAFLPAEKFAEAVTGLPTRCKLVINNLDNVGKHCAYKTVLVPMPCDATRHLPWSDSDFECWWRKTACVTLIKDIADGWRVIVPGKFTFTDHNRGFYKVRLYRYLERGEIEKIIDDERAGAAAARAVPSEAKEAGEATESAATDEADDSAKTEEPKESAT